MASVETPDEKASSELAQLGARSGIRSFHTLTMMMYASIAPFLVDKADYNSQLQTVDPVIKKQEMRIKIFEI